MYVITVVHIATGYVAICRGFIVIIKTGQRGTELEVKEETGYACVLSQACITQFFQLVFCCSLLNLLLVL